MLMGETDARSPGREMVEVIHAEWSQELREVRRKFADDVASEMDRREERPSRMSENYSEFWSAERGAKKPKRRLRPDD